MTTLIGVVIAVICFMLLIISHEAGHFFAGKAMGMQINEFSCGMGPLLWSKTKGETQYSIRAVPLGGYCAFEAEDEKSENPRAFTNQPWWSRILVLLSGPFTNIVIGILIFTLLFAYIGFSTTTIDRTIEGCPAEQAGIQAGDVILSVNGTDVDNWTEAQTEIAATSGDNATIEVRRGNDIKLINCGTYTNEYGNKAIGIYSRVSHNLKQAFKTGLSETALVAVSIRDFLVSVFQGKASADDVTGVVGIVAVMGEAYQYGFINVIYLIAMITANLGYMNLLPIPALDGGRILIILIDKLSGGRLSAKAQAVINGIGMALLLMLMVFLMFKDTISLIR